MMDRKLLAGFIDQAAGRSEIVDAEPATRKQCWFLSGLIIGASDHAQEDEFVLNTSFVLTKKRASNLISNYLA